MINQDIYLSKAKRKDNEEWVEGFIFIWNLNPRYDKAYIRTDDYKEFEIDPNTICRSTGMYDKNNRLMFENDNIKKSSYWKGDKSGNEYKTITWKSKRNGTGFNIASNLWEIIGNKFDKEKEDEKN